MDFFFNTPVGLGILVTAGFSIVCWTWGIRASEKSPDGTRGPMPTLPLMILVASSCSALFLAFYAFAFGASELLPAPVQDSTGAVAIQGLRVPAVTVAAGLFGGVLFVAFTVLKYRSHVQADEKLILEQRAAEIESADHLYGRFAQAAEMMGSERAATRMGGVYALAALADEWPENRQQCVDLLCGYMRTPMQAVIDPQSEKREKGDLPAPVEIPVSMVTGRIASSSAEPELRAELRRKQVQISNKYKEHAPLDELAVRRAIMASIARGTRRPLGHSASWSTMTFDLERCFLPEVNFSGCHFRESISFEGSNFIGKTTMQGATFDKAVKFTGCVFSRHALFSDVTFGDLVSFRAALFRSTANFLSATFKGNMMFANANFTGTLFLQGSSFAGVSKGGSSGRKIANWHGVEFARKQSACPESEESIWSRIASAPQNFRIICEKEHPDRTARWEHYFPSSISVK